MVMEEIERSFASERDVQELEKSFHEEETLHDEQHKETIPSGHTDLLSEIPDTQETLVESRNDCEISPKESEPHTVILPQAESQDVRSKDLGKLYGSVCFIGFTKRVIKPFLEIWFVRVQNYKVTLNMSNDWLYMISNIVNRAYFFFITLKIGFI